MKLRKKPGMIRGFLVIVLIGLYVIAVFQGMGDGGQTEVFLIAVPALIILIMFAEVIAGRVYPSKEEELRRIAKDLRTEEEDDAEKPITLEKTKKKSSARNMHLNSKKKKIKPTN